jgi:hypothetical protein
VAARQNAKVPDTLAAQFSNTTAKTWLDQLVLIYLGKGDPNALLQLVTQTQMAARGQRCDVGFFIGEWFLIQNDLAKAKATLQQASKDLCDDDPYTNHLISIDLARMQ